MPQAFNGPIPKRSTERRRRNKAPGATPLTAAGKVRVPFVPKGAHPIARQWFLALKASGQAQFFEPTDWAAALIVMEQMTRLLAPRLLVPKEGPVVEYSAPLTGPEFGTLWASMNDLLTTEAARRRAHMEITRELKPDAVPAGVADLESFRRREQA